MNGNFTPEYINERIANNMCHFGHLMNKDAQVVPSPIYITDVYDGHDDAGPLFLIGHLNGEPIYRTTHTVAHYLEKKKRCCIKWPPLFPNVWLPECSLMQRDVVIPGIIPAFVEEMINDDDDDDHNDDRNDYSDTVYEFIANEEDDTHSINDEYDIVDIIDEEKELEGTYTVVEKINIK
ncbi:unnamed protein product [Adineta ricciae]|uniref:Uncharacterized protein n=1 Tax=Adineta ricciae TaxID=249248 RepID=A0A814RC84_ADIRI|nr:unnamed protein product [Adineta ricciae]CAF1440808.1 unnamed protein product [Adineta ricciae]